MSKYWAIDVGSKTLGVAKSDGFVANPFLTLRFEENNFHEAVDKIKPYFASEKPKVVVVGWPINMNNTEGHRVEMVQDFLDQLISEFSEIEIVKIDERLTTRMAKSIMIEANLSRKKQKANKDTLAAVLILESFLQKNNSTLK